MFHVYFDASKEALERVFTGIVEKYDLAITANLKEINPSCCVTELSFGDSFSFIPQEVLDKAFDQLESEFKKV